MANATLNSKSVALTENDIPRAAKKDANLQNLKEEACPASTWWFGRHYEYGVHSDRFLPYVSSATKWKSA